ncbi:MULTISPECIES: TetR/AcrR family transcriptional regulator [unclassified Sinorhizobium]|uniref:TetR/AcrR family transcriptional regulator n=1 Tax=unclassified Sinorhizobium TaxID=2613772 RepID=UPI00352679B9
MAETRKLTRAEQKVQRPLQILDAAFEEFTKKGFAATRVEDIADRVGVTKGTVYVYFETKEKLFESMIEYISAPFQETLRNYPGGSGDPAKELETFLGFLFDHLVDDRKMRELFRFVVAEGPKFPELMDRHHEDFMEPVFSRIDDILDNGVTQKKFRAKPAELAKIVMSPIAGMLVFRLIFEDRRTVDKNAVLSTHLQLILRGLLV